MLRVMYKNAAQTWLSIIMAARGDLSDLKMEVIVGVHLEGASVTDSSTC